MELDLGALYLDLSRANHNFWPVDDSSFDTGTKVSL